MSQAHVEIVIGRLLTDTAFRRAFLQWPLRLIAALRQEGWQDRALSLVGSQSAALDAMRDEVVGITPTPGSLRPCAPRNLTRRGRTRALATADAPVRHKPATADAAGTLREHPQMLASSTGTQGGPLLASNPGSILASAEGQRSHNDVTTTQNMIMAVTYMV